uniref:(northern house mosquito) hypothetical protein n=1 Tax=Culex pipiens TaxID=7175 RepID=A0A8D8B4Y0_CULPI
MIVRVPMTSVVVQQTLRVTAVRMPMTTPSPMRMPMTPTAAAVTMPVGATMLERVNANQVDQQPQHRHHKQPLVLHLRRFDRALHRLGHDEEGDKQQEQTVDEAGQHLGAHVPVRVLVGGLPLGDDGRGQAREQPGAVEEHVERVRDET